MKMITLAVLPVLFMSCGRKASGAPEAFRHVDQVLWVVSDLDRTVRHWRDLGFDQVADLDTVEARFVKSGRTETLRMAVANLGGAFVAWMQPVAGDPVFRGFRDSHGDGAMALVHRPADQTALADELKRLSGIGVGVLDEARIATRRGELRYVLMDTREGGKYTLGYTLGGPESGWMAALSPGNRHGMRINQYAFAVRDATPVSDYWQKVGFPAFQMSHPVLGKKFYHGRPVDHDLMQGWQRQGDIAYEWCIPLSTPIVYDDHIRKHGEGIHHLAFAVKDMDAVLKDYRAKGYGVSMGGTWGEEGQPGSGRYEYIDLEEAGGVTMELLWSHDG